MLTKSYLTLALDGLTTFDFFGRAIFFAFAAAA